MRQQMIGRRHAADTDTGQADHPENMQAREKHQPAPHHRHQTRLADIGLQDHRNQRGDQQDKTDDIARHILAPSPFREGPGDQHHKGRFEKFRGLDAHPRQIDPAARAFDLDTPDQSGKHQRHTAEIDQQSRPAHITRIEEADQQHHASRRDHEKDLPLDEMELRQTQTVGHRRGTRQTENDTRQHQSEDQSQHHPVHRPPPIDKRRAFYP